MNLLYCGDNLDVLRRCIADESIDLIYLDPPFKSDRHYHVAIADRGSSQRPGGQPRAAQRSRAFDDTWDWNSQAEQSYRETVGQGGKVAEAVQALRSLLGEHGLLAYLVVMAPRLKELYRVLKRSGTMYLHCDPNASHYLKILLDATFGADQMRNEIVWCYRGGGVPKRDFARKHDIIFRYSKTDLYCFNRDAIRIPYSEDVLRSKPSRYDKSYRSNKVYEGYRPNPAGKHPEDWWTIQAILPSSGERLGYPTQKPEALLERIVRASSDEGDVVLDPVCGCGTTLAVAQRLNRQWIGIDVNALAIRLTEKRLANQMELFARFDVADLDDRATAVKQVR